jgi:hypothetical protein
MCSRHFRHDQGGENEGGTTHTKLSFEVWPNANYEDLDTVGVSTNSWGDTPIEWCVEKTARVAIIDGNKRRGEDGYPFDPRRSNGSQSVRRWNELTPT